MENYLDNINKKYTFQIPMSDIIKGVNMANNMIPN